MSFKAGFFAASPPSKPADPPAEVVSSAALPPTTASDGAPQLLSDVLSPAQMTPEQLVDPTLLPHNLIVQLDNLVLQFYALEAEKVRLLATVEGDTPAGEAWWSPEFREQVEAFRAEWTRFTRLVRAVVGSQGDPASQ